MIAAVTVVVEDMIDREIESGIVFVFIFIQEEHWVQVWPIRCFCLAWWRNWF